LARPGGPPLLDGPNGGKDDELQQERRKYTRLARPVEGAWQADSAGMPCRIADLSLGGCYIDSTATPEPGATTTVRLTCGDHRATLRGRVVYVDRDLGFAVEFEPPADADRDALQHLLAQLDPGRPEAPGESGSGASRVPDVHDGQGGSPDASPPPGQ